MKQTVYYIYKIRRCINTAILIALLSSLSTYFSTALADSNYGNMEEAIAIKEMAVKKDMENAASEEVKAKRDLEKAALAKDKAHKHLEDAAIAKARAIQALQNAVLSEARAKQDIASAALAEAKARQELANAALTEARAKQELANLALEKAKARQDLANRALAEAKARQDAAGEALEDVKAYGIPERPVTYVPETRDLEAERIREAFKSTVNRYGKNLTSKIKGGVRFFKVFKDSLQETLEKTLEESRAKPALEKAPIVKIKPKEEVVEEIPPEVVEEIPEKPKPEIKLPKLSPEEVKVEPKPEVVKEIPPEVVEEIPEVPKPEPDVAEEAPVEEEPKPAVQKGKAQEWITPVKRAVASYDFSGYTRDNQMKFSFKDETFELQNPVFKRGNEIWVPVAELTHKMGMVFLDIDESTFGIINLDGITVEMKINDKVGRVNKLPYLELPQEPVVFEGIIMMTVSSVAEVLDIDHEFDEAANIVKFIKEITEGFSTFTVEKPEEVEEVEEVERISPLFGKLPQIREELLPARYQPDIDLDFANSYSYLDDKFHGSRTRTAEWTLRGRAFDFKVDGRLRMRDERATNKQKFAEDSEFIGLYRDDLWIKLMDNYLSLHPLRSQSESYFGTEVTYLRDPLKSTFIYGQTDNSVAGPADVGSVKFFGDLYALRQEYKDPNGLFDVTGMGIWTENYAEFQEKSSKTDYPRRNQVYLFDSTVHLYPKLDFRYTHAVCNYVPDDKRNARFLDKNYRTQISFSQERYSFNASYEFVGDQYASVGIPSTYQNHKGYEASTRFVFSPNWSVGASGRFTKNNVDRNPRIPTNFNRGFTLTSSHAFPWDQNINLNLNVNESKTRGGDEDMSGSRYKDYRIDYIKGFGTATVQLGASHYVLEPFGISEFRLFSDTFSGSIFKYFPKWHGSYIRFYQDFKKTKTNAANSYATALWNTDLGLRLNLASYLSGYANCRITTTQREEFADTAMTTLRLGGEVKMSPVTSFNVDCTLTDYNLYDEDRNTKHYTIMFKLKHIFDIVTPAKWGRVKVYVFRDINSNGVFDEGEPGVPDVETYVVRGRSAITDRNGCAYIKKVVPGDRQVKLDMRKLPVEVTIRGLTVKEVEVLPKKTVRVDFPLVKTGIIKGMIYVDSNRNGEYDFIGDMGLPNIRVYLLPGEKDTLSLSDGTFYMDSVYPGEYDVCVDLNTVPPEYRLATPESISIKVEELKKIEDLLFGFSSKPIDFDFFMKDESVEL